MKIRTGFVANSSSSSFFISLYGVVFNLKDIAKYNESFMINLKSLIRCSNTSLNKEIVDMHLQELDRILSNFAKYSDEPESYSILSLKLNIDNVNLYVQFICVRSYLYIGITFNHFIEALENNTSITVDRIQDILYKIISTCGRDISGFSIPLIKTHEEEYTVMD